MNNIIQVMSELSKAKLNDSYDQSVAEKIIREFVIQSFVSACQDCAKGLLAFKDERDGNVWIHMIERKFDEVHTRQCQAQALRNLCDKKEEGVK